MPILKIQTNQPVDDVTRAVLLAEASLTVTAALGKPERYVMVAIEPTAAMIFAGNMAPLAYLELKSISLPVSRTASLSQALCHLMNKTLGIPSERIYIEFAEADGKMWGWNGGTF